jgi:predicted transcriptional regulator
MRLFICFSHYNIIMKYFVSFTKSELEALRLFDSFENINELAKVLTKSKSQTYRLLQKLNEKNIIDDGKLVNLPYLKKLVLLIRKNKNLTKLFSGSGLAVLLQLLYSKKISEIALLLDSDEQTVYKIIQKARQIGLVKEEEKKYVINEKNWLEGKDFLESLYEQEMSFDQRIPKNSIIYFKSEKEIVFSTEESVDASPAAFSAFEKCGVKFFPETNYYVLPKQKYLGEKVYDQALKVVEKNWDYRLLVILGIFVLKNKISSDKRLVKEFQLIFAGREIDKMPLPKNFREKASEYGVKV